MVAVHAEPARSQAFEVGIIDFYGVRTVSEDEPTVVSNAPSIASRTSCMSPTRSFGFFCKHVWRSWRTRGGVSAGRTSQAGSDFNTVASNSVTVRIGQ